MKGEHEKVKIIVTVVAMTIVSGVSIWFANVSLNKRLQKKYAEAVAENMIYTSSAEIQQEEINKEYNKPDNTEQVVDILGQNQIAKEVKYGDADLLWMPTCDIKCHIYEGTEHESLLYGCGWYRNTKRIGEKGVCAVAGHSSDTWECIFNNIKDVEFMDEFYVFDDEGVKHTYYVTGMYVVNPDAVEELSTDDETYSIFKIITCCNDGTQRLIIEGTELSKAEIDEYISNLKVLKRNKILNMTETDFDILSRYTYQERFAIEPKWYYANPSKVYFVIEDKHIPHYEATDSLYE